MSLCRHCNAIDITTLISTLSSDGNKAHHRTFRELKQSAESCPLCALFVEKLEKLDYKYDYDRIDKAGAFEGIHYTGLHGKNTFRIKETDPKFLTGLTMMCQGGMATVDVYASEGQLLLIYH